MRKPIIHNHTHLPGRHTSQESQDVASAAQQLDTATDQLNQYLDSLTELCQADGCDIDGLTAELTKKIHQVEDYCRSVEAELGDIEAIREKQAEFRQRTDQHFSKSYFMNRARSWPRGYPGDYEIIESAYNDKPRTEGIGELLDRYLLASTLGRGIRHRRNKMREMLTEELLARPGAQVLNIGCGPCREVLELAPVIQQTNAHFTNIDFDTDALLFSAERLAKAGIADHTSFRQYNAVRMVNAKRNIREFGQFDVIYSIGLLDYLTDEILVRLLNSLQATLKPGGVFIAVFKDSDQYATQDYHWLVDWSGFRQRDAQASRALLDEAGITNDAVAVSRTQDSVMIFYRVLQTADATAAASLQGPHDRRQEIARACDKMDAQRGDRPARPSWRKPEQTR